MKRLALVLLLSLSSALAVKVEWASPSPQILDEGRVVRLEVRVWPDPGESILSVRAVALPSMKPILESRPGARGGVVARYWDTTGFGGTRGVQLMVEYTGVKTGTAYAFLPVQVQGGPLAQNSLQAQGLMEDLDGFITQACRVIGFYDLASVRWLCTAHRTVKKAVNYWNQLGDMWEDFKNQAIYYGTGIALDWLGKALGLHTLNPVVGQIDQTLTNFMSDIRRAKNAILNSLAQIRMQQIQELEGWQPDQNYPYWGPEWWTRMVAGAVPQLRFEATQQSLRDLQRTAQLLENQSRVAQNIKNQQENTSLENTLQDLWDTLGSAWNFIKEAVQNGWTTLTGGLSRASLGAAPSGAPSPLASPAPSGSSFAAPSPGSTPTGQGVGAANNSSGGSGPMSDGITERLQAEAQSAPSTREVTEIVVKGLAELIRLQAQDSFRAVQELKNLATQQAMTVEQLAQVNQNLVELIRKQEQAQTDALRQTMARIASQAEGTSARYISAAEAMQILATQWRAQSTTTGGTP